MRFSAHNKTSKGYCRTCRSHKCWKTSFIPQYPAPWTWEQRYARWMMGASDYTKKMLNFDKLKEEIRKLKEEEE